MIVGDTAEYRYIFADLLTNTVLAERPLTGVTFSRVLNKPGLFQGYFGLDREGYDNQETLNSTIPGRTAYYIERNGVLVAGGIIWSRLYSEQSKSLQFNGQTFESFAYQEDVRTTITYANVDQRNLLADLFLKLQAYPSRNIGIILPAAFTPHILRSYTFNDYELWSFGKAIELIQGYDQGFDYTIDVAYDTNGVPSKYLITDDILGQAVANTQLVFDYPGNIANFYVPENAAKAATTIAGIGAGEGSAIVRSLATNASLLAGGYPEIVQFYTNKDVAVQSTLDSLVAANLNQLEMPVSVITYVLNPNIDPSFGTYRLGDYGRFHLESPRFPNGYEATARVIGWDVTPPEGDSVEKVNLTIAESDAAL